MLCVQKCPDFQGFLIVLLHLIRVREARRYQDVNSRTCTVGNSFFEKLFCGFDAGVQLIVVKMLEWFIEGGLEIDGHIRALELVEQWGHFFIVRADIAGDVT